MGRRWICWLVKQRGDRVNTVPELCKGQHCAELWVAFTAYRFVYQLQFDAPSPTGKLSLVYLFNKSQRGQWPLQGWLSFCASWWTGERNRLKVWRCFPAPGLPRNCSMTLAESLLLYCPRVLPLTQEIPGLTQEESMIPWFLFQDFQLPRVAAWTVSEGPQNSSTVIAMYILIAAAVVTEPPPPGFPL